MLGGIRQVIFCDHALSCANAMPQGASRAGPSSSEFPRPHFRSHSNIFLRYALDIDLPDFVVEDPIIEALNQGTNDLVTWSNASLRSVDAVYHLTNHFSRTYFLTMLSNRGAILIT